MQQIEISTGNAKKRGNIAWRARFPHMQMDVKVDGWSLKSETIVRR